MNKKSMAAEDKANARASVGIPCYFCNKRLSSSKLSYLKVKNGEYKPVCEGCKGLGSA